MVYATFINAIILALSAAVIFFLKNPLGLFGILLLQDMPYAFMANNNNNNSNNNEEECGEYEGGQIGFVTQSS